MFYKFIRFIVNIFFSLLFKIEVTGANNVPKGGSLIISANHIHWGDPVLLVCKGTNRQIHFMAKIELFKNKLFSWFLKNIDVIPIKRGQNDLNAIKNSLRVLKADKVLGIFPEGTRVKAGQEVKPESGLAMLAIKTETPIVPMGIKGNYKFRSKLILNIGKPIFLNEYYGKKVKKDELEKITEEIMTVIRNLSNQ